MKSSVEKKLEIANKFIFVKAYEVAKDVLLDIIKSEEKASNLIVHLRYAELCARTGEQKECEILYDELLSDGTVDLKTSQFGKTFLKLYTDGEENSLQASDYKDLAKNFPDEAASFYVIAYAYESQGEWTEAVRNYELALSIDQNWYPCYFGLSQVYYNIGNDAKGDQHFYLYERSAPFSLYGNFDTHRKLCNDFVEAESYEYALIAIETLETWWVENRGECPKEISIYASLTKARVHMFAGDRDLSRKKRLEGIDLAKSATCDPSVGSQALYFVAKVLEEHAEFDLAFSVYEVILSRESVNPQIIQRIGSQFLSLGQASKAVELFEKAYIKNPFNQELAFARLVAGLKDEEVDADQYLNLRDNMKILSETGKDQVELFSLLHQLYSMYQRDVDVHQEFATLFFGMDNAERAVFHLQQAVELESFHPTVVLKAANLYLANGYIDEAKKAVDLISGEDKVARNQIEQYLWVRATIEIQNENYDKAREYTKSLNERDAWNVSYLVQKIFLDLKSYPTEEDPAEDAVVEKLVAGEDSDLDWKEYDQLTNTMDSVSDGELKYLRLKLRYLYAKGESIYLDRIVDHACRFDPVRCGDELMKLVNTNFDSVSLYIGLADIFAAQWLLQMSSYWADKALAFDNVPNVTKQRIYSRIADNLLWEKANLDKAVKYAQLAYELGSEEDAESHKILGHAYLSQGQVQKARDHLEKCNSGTFEQQYLKGLLEYRNGATKKAAAIWKPLLTFPSRTLKHHQLKRELLKYYFDSEPYLKVN